MGRKIGTGDPAKLVPKGKFRYSDSMLKCSHGANSNNLCRRRA